MSKDEAIRLGDFTYLKPNHDERFTTDKDFYRNNEQGIIYQDGEPLIGLTFKKISTENTEAMKEYYTEAQLRKHQKNNHEIALEVEIQNFNYDDLASLIGVYCSLNIRASQFSSNTRNLVPRFKR